MAYSILFFSLASMMLPLALSQTVRILFHAHFPLYQLYATYLQNYSRCIRASIACVVLRSAFDLLRLWRN